MISLSLCAEIVSAYNNPLTLRAAKRGLTILEIFHLQTHFLENIWRRSQAKQELSFKYFVNFCFIQKIFSKVSE